MFNTLHEPLSLDQNYSKFPIIFSSGLSNPADIDPYLWLNLPIGIDINRVPRYSSNEDRLIEHNYNNGYLFIDNGAYNAFTHGRTLNFKKILIRYRQLAVTMKNNHLIYMVAPDIIGDQQTTKTLLINFADEINELLQMKVRVILPVQKGVESMSSVMSEISDSLYGYYSIGLPMNKKGLSDKEVIDFIKCTNPGAIHFLGMGKRNKRFSYLLSKIENTIDGNDIHITADSNQVKALVGEGRPLTMSVWEKSPASVMAAIKYGDPYLGIEPGIEPLDAAKKISPYLRRTELHRIIKERCNSKDVREKRDAKCLYANQIALPF
jgi:hypothetical protein